jgi:hypothetical protein
MPFKIVKSYDLRIILKSGASLIAKNVSSWTFGKNTWNIKWLEFSNISLLENEEIAAVEIVKIRRKLKLV